MNSVLTNIHKRVSVRTFQSRKMDEPAKKELTAFMKAIKKGPLGSSIRFELVEVEEGDLPVLKELGTYGTVRGALQFIAGAVTKGTRAMEDFGFGLETIILKATELGLGTVWLAGSLNRTTFGKKIGLLPDELLPAISPVGYQAAKPTFRDKLIRSIARSAKRREFTELFFETKAGKPLVKQAIGSYGEILEGVRLAPSASNKQPWRIIKETGKNTFHFYMNEDKAYNHFFKDIQMQNIDLGIAMCHFELAAKELGVPGKWVVTKPALDAGKLVYIVSWQG